MAATIADVCVATLVVVVVVISFTPLILPSSLLASPWCGGPLSASPHASPVRTDASVKPPILDHRMLFPSRPPTSVPPVVRSRRRLGSRSIVMAPPMVTTTRSPSVGR